MKKVLIFVLCSGVLNPLELSRISGSHSRANSELTMIDEEEENALEGDADIAAASPMLQDIEENLFKPSASSTPAPASLVCLYSLNIM